MSADPLVGGGDGGTPLPDEDLDDLLLSYITTRGELDEAEQANIARALSLPPPSFERLCDDKFLRDLHAAMFGEVWAWAGMYRTRELSIGIDPAQIAVRVRDLVTDARVWAYGADEDELDVAAARLSHRLVQIHPFLNGNGRHSRHVADLYLRAVGRPSFSWGANSGDPIVRLRHRYLDALRRADLDPDDLGGLVAFARS